MFNNSRKKKFTYNKSANINIIDTNKNLKTIWLMDIALKESNYNKNLIDTNKSSITLIENKIYDNKKIGFDKLGNTCYLSRRLQIILHLKIFENIITSNKKFHLKNLTASLVNLIENIEF